MDLVALYAGCEEVDGGSAPFREDLKTALEERGITHFKYLLNTHFHEDHISGLYLSLIHISITSSDANAPR